MTKTVWARRKKVALNLVLIAWAITVPVLIVSIAFSPPPADLYLRMYPGETFSFNVTATNLSDKPINTTIAILGLRMFPTLERVGNGPWIIVQPHQKQNLTVAVRLVYPEPSSQRWVIAYLYAENESRQLISQAVVSLSIFKIAVIISLTRSL